MKSQPLSLIIKASNKALEGSSPFSKIDLLKSKLEKQNVDIVHLENLGNLVINTSEKQWADLKKDIKELVSGDFDIVENKLMQVKALPINPFTPEFSLRRVALAANSEDPWIQWHEHLIHWVDEACDIIINDRLDTPPTVILDIATGTGGPLFSFIKAFPNSTIQACDIDENLLEIGRIFTEEISAYNVDFSVANAENLEYPANSFDLVTCLFSFMYFENPNKVLEEIQRVIMPKSKAYIVTWGEKNALLDLVMKALDWSPEYKYQEGKDPHAYSDSQKMIDLLQDRNLESYTINDHKINMKWKGTAYELWEFFKSSNVAVSKHLSNMDNTAKGKIELEIIQEFEKMNDGDFIKMPVDIVMTTIQF